MQKTIMPLICFLIIALSVSATQTDGRPEFDKKPYLKTCWSQANPWWLPNRSCLNGKGGPDYAWHSYPENEVLMWKKIAEICTPYGMTGLQLEITLRSNGMIDWWQSLKRVADGFQTAGNGFKTSLFLSVHKAANEESAIEQMDNLFEKVWPILKEHPAVYRLNGAPVIIIYTPSIYSPETWHKIISNVEKKYGKIIILANAWDRGLRNNPKVLTEYLNVFDGITAYANWTDAGQREFHAMVTDIMHKEFPQKIFEASVHNTYTVHFSYSGIAPNLMGKYFKSWNNAIESRPDAIVMTNFFDIYENSRILPSYELDDILLRTARHYLEEWRGNKISKETAPDVYVTNFTNVLLGQAVNFEVISFPSTKSSTQASIILEICDAKGKMLHSFEPRTIELNTITREVFELPSLQFSDELALFPRLKIESKDFKQNLDISPPTMLVAGMRPHLLWWARSLKNMLIINKGERTWSLNNIINGTIMKYPDYGLAVIQSDAASNSNGGRNQGGGTVRIMRNGREFQKISNWSLDMTHSILLPNPIGSLDWYSLELVNNDGCRYLSRPIWVSGERYDQKIKLPVISAENKLVEITINADRVPYFYYPCKIDSGPLLLDYSGYQHNGFLGGSGFGGGHLDRTAYHHEHLDGLKKNKGNNSPGFINDNLHGGFYRFNGEQHITIQGGTAFPYASTYEIAIKPQKTGREMGIMGAGNNQIQLSLNPGGYIIVERSSEVEGEGGMKADRKVSVLLQSQVPVLFDKWNRIAVVYDLKKLSLYLDGKLQAEQNIIPCRGHEFMNTIIIGGKCHQYWQPYQYFIGDIKDIRIYGRNLSCDEFLK